MGVTTQHMEPIKRKKRHNKKEKRKDSSDFYLLSPKSPFQFLEAYNSLRTNLKFMLLSNACKKILVTSSIPNEGKSNVAANLAISLASAGSRVVLIDCDLRKPVLHRYMKTQGKPGIGLTKILSGETLEENIIRISDINLCILPAGPIPPNPAELLGSAAMKTLMMRIQTMCDYIIFDTPPVSVVTDAAVLSQYTDGVLLVVRQRKVKVSQAQLAKKALDAVNAKILGVVMNDFNLKHVDRESGYYYNYYEYNEKN